MANTKLTTEQKTNRKLMLEVASEKGIRVINLNGETVVAYKRYENTVKFALSVMSPDERKFRLKVGQYFALHRYFCSQYAVMNTQEFEYMCQEVFGYWGPTYQ